MIKEQIKDAILDMKGKVGRNDEHIYINNETGEYLQGVSTVSSIVPKDWLAAWGAKEAVKALGYSDYKDDIAVASQVWNKIKACDSVYNYIEILKEAKGQHARKSKKAMIDGTLGHKWLETHVESQINGTEKPLVPINTPLERPIRQFLAWELNEVDYWIASEALVIRPDKKYAGQLDAIYMSKKGKLTLCDFKFASNISEDYYLQTAGYAASFEPYGIKFDKRVIIRLPKTLEKDEYNPKTYQYEKISNDIEPHEVPTAYEVDRDVFFGALPLKSWINSVEKAKKR